MRYETGDAYLADTRKAVFLFGMSGVGKTRAADRLRQTGSWYHYSVDYRIGTHYLGQQISDMLKRTAMEVSLFRDLLRSDSIQIHPNLAFDNLALLSTYIGAPGDPARGGLSFEEYCRRQRRHREAEITATRDAGEFLDRAREIYGYDCFACDASGSVCELADPADPQDPLFTRIAEHMVPVYIRASEADRETLLRRFDQHPKPMYFDEIFLLEMWRNHCGQRPEAEIDPAGFLRDAFGRLIEHRLPRYEGLARRWGATVEADELAATRTAEEFNQLIAGAIDRRGTD